MVRCALLVSSTAQISYEQRHKHDDSIMLFFATSSIARHVEFKSTRTLHDTVLISMEAMSY